MSEKHTLTHFGRVAKSDFPFLSSISSSSFFGSQFSAQSKCHIFKFASLLLETEKCHKVLLNKISHGENFIPSPRLFCSASEQKNGIEKRNTTALIAPQLLSDKTGLIMGFLQFHNSNLMPSPNWSVFINVDY